jgi:hypothetical protein
MAFALAAIFFDASGRVAVEHALSNGVTEDNAQRLEQMLCRFRCVGLGTNDRGDVLAMQAPQRLAAVRPTKPLQDVATRRLSAWPQAEKVGRAIIGNAQRIERTGFGALRADGCCLRLHAVKRSSVLPHEVLRPRRAG